jgi:hypothetical protein
VKWDVGDVAADPGVVELTTQDPDDFDALYAELRGVPGILVRAVPAPVVPGEQGSALDLLTVACSGGAITVFLQIVKTLLESRGPGFVLKIQRGRDRLEIAADNVEEALPLVRQLLDGS